MCGIGILDQEKFEQIIANADCDKHTRNGHRKCREEGDSKGLMKSYEETSNHSKITVLNKSDAKPSNTNNM